MIITTNNSDQALNNFIIKEVEPNKDAWQVLHFQLNTLHKANTWDVTSLQLAVKSINHTIKDDSSFLFFCSEGDGILLSKVSAHNDLKNTGLQLKLAFGKSDLLFKVYTLSSDWESFSKFCKKKESKSIKLASNITKTGHKLKDIKIDKDHAKKLLEQRKNRKGTYILLAEDNNFTMELLSEVLAQYTVIKARDGYEAIESYMLNAPDIMFLDIEMPKYNGKEVLKIIHKFDSDAFIIMLSGNGNMKNITSTMNAGAKGFITKPFASKKLLNYVNIYKTIKETAVDL